jgi:hypothetical protein
MCGEARFSMSRTRPGKSRLLPANYPGLVGDIGALLETARRSSARAVNALMTATYWDIGRRIVEFEQGGEKRAGYGAELLERLAQDLTTRFGRGFSRRNLQDMRSLYQVFPPEQIERTLSAKSATPPLEPATASIRQTPSAKSEPATIASIPSNESSPAITPQTASALSPAVPLSLGRTTSC